MPRTIVLTGEPKSTQHIYRIARFGSRAGLIMTAEGKALKEDYGWQAKVQWNDTPTGHDLVVSARFFFKTKRRFDIDNANKLWLDALTGIVWEDDSQIWHLDLERRYDPKNPRIEIKVLEISPPVTL